VAEDKKEDSEKTEEATQHRVEESRKKGQVAFSRDLLHWVILATFLLFSVNFLYTNAATLGRHLSLFLEKAHTIPLSPDYLSQGMILLFKTTSFTFGLFLFMGFVLVLFLGFAQTKLLFSAESLKPKLSKISPMQGLKRMFGKKALMEFGKGLFKMMIIVLGVSFVLNRLVKDVVSSYQLSFIQGFYWLKSGIEHILWVTLSMLGVLAFLDYFYQRFSHLKEIRMTKQEVKEEHKEQDGNPEVKQKLKQLAQERLQQRMMQEVPYATAIVVNPTHYSVALRYDMDTMPAPKVVAKGVDHVALRIREVAKKHGIPIIENPPLARNLFEIVNLDEEIPMHHYKAVAEIIRTVMKLKSNRF
jgi:flagellar biosynthetic protein FlhB